MEVNSLVRVHDRRRGTVTKIEKPENPNAKNNPHRQQSHGQTVRLLHHIVCF